MGTLASAIVIFAYAAALILIYAPAGYEDEEGFHYGEPPDTN